jgi:hypothetical protein
VFRPLWQTIRARELTAVFPGERAADLIARLAVWRAAEATDHDWQVALQKFVAAQALNGTSRVTTRNA